MGQPWEPRSRDPPCNLFRQSMGSGWVGNFSNASRSMGKKSSFSKVSGNMLSFLDTVGWDAVKNIISCVEKCIYCIHPFDISGSKRNSESKEKIHHVFCIKASTMRLDHATLEAETGAEVQPCCESRGSEEMNFERSVNLRRNSIQELD